MDAGSGVLVLIAGETSDPMLELTAVFDFFSSLFRPSEDPVVQIDQAALVRRIANTVAAAEVAIAVKVEQTQRAQQIADNWKPAQVGKGIGEQIGLARRTSPSGGALHLSFARSLMSRFPRAFDELRFGRVSEQACKTLVTKTSHLSDVQAGVIDADLAPRLQGWNQAQTETAVCSAAYEIDPHGWVERRRNAERERRVWIRPAPDTMSIVSALLPAAQGVAMFASLKHAANTAVGVGDERGLGQVMADTLVERVTGQTAAPEVPTEVLLTVTPETLFGGGDEPGWLQHYGAIPAELARALASGNASAESEHQCGGHEPVGDSWYPLAGKPPTEYPASDEVPALDHGPAPAGGAKGRGRRRKSGSRSSSRSLSRQTIPNGSSGTSGGQRHGTACGPTGFSAPEMKRARVWIRRVLTDPITGVAIDVDQRRRRFDGVVRRLISIRDRECRGPFCSAPIREHDHVDGWAEGGLTEVENGQGVCQRNNQLKELKGWTVTKSKKAGEIVTRTPTGHTYRTSPPRQLGYPAGTIADPSPVVGGAWVG